MTILCCVVQWSLPILILTIKVNSTKLELLIFLREFSHSMKISIFGSEVYRLHFLGVLNVFCKRMSSFKYEIESTIMKYKFTGIV
jgi:hypothetical protein